MSLGSTFQADITPGPGEGSLLFRGYEDDCFIIGEGRYHSGLCFQKGKLIEPWGPIKFSELTLEDIAWVFENPPEVLLIGSGRTTAFPDTAILDALADAHIGFECMDSRAAARTYNILLAEGRDVSAAVLLPNARN